MCAIRGRCKARDQVAEEQTFPCTLLHDEDASHEEATSPQLTVTVDARPVQSPGHTTKIS